jgi:hypothetical protein
MRKYQTISDIDDTTQEGKLLLCAICCLTDDSFGPNGKRHPDDVLEILKEREVIMYSEGTMEFRENLLDVYRREKKIKKIMNKYGK